MGDETLLNGTITEDDIIHRGWLTKSPPEKKIKNAASWTNRYFRLLYLTKEMFEELRQQCTKEDPVEAKSEIEASKNDQHPTRLCLAFWKTMSTSEKPLRE